MKDEGVGKKSKKERHVYSLKAHSRLKTPSFKDANLWNKPTEQSTDWGFLQVGHESATVATSV